MERSTSRNLWIGLGIVAVVLLVASSWGGGMMFGGGPVGPMGVGYRPFVAPWLFGMWGIGLLVRVLFVGLIFWLIFGVFRRRRGYRRGYYDGYTDTHDYTSQEPPAEEILRRRYASGEITREQYEEMRRTLQPA
jgi:uncharacterized membrane protein